MGVGGQMGHGGRWVGGWGWIGGTDEQLEGCGHARGMPRCKWGGDGGGREARPACYGSRKGIRGPLPGSAPSREPSRHVGVDPKGTLSFLCLS